LLPFLTSFLRIFFFVGLLGVLVGIVLCEISFLLDAAEFKTCELKLADVAKLDCGILGRLEVAKLDCAKLGEAICEFVIFKWEELRIPCFSLCLEDPGGVE